MTPPATIMEEASLSPSVDIALIEKKLEADSTNYKLRAARLIIDFKNGSCLETCSGVVPAVSAINTMHK